MNTNPLLNLLNSNIMLNKLKQFVFSEKFIFTLFLAGSIVPLFFVRYVPSLDGPKHLFVGQVVKQLWLGNGFFEQFYALNPLYNGNVLGNYLIAFFMLFLPTWLAEKLFLVLYIVVLATGFRQLQIAIARKASHMGVLVFAFVYTSLFMLGYYNFSLAIGIMFFALAYWINHYKAIGLKQMVVLALLILLCYYAHIFVFGFLLLLMGFHILFNYLTSLRQPATFRIFAKRTFLAFLAALPALVLAFFYVQVIMKFPASEGGGVGDIMDKIRYLQQMRMLVGYSQRLELPVTSIVFYALMILMVIALAWRLKYWLLSKKPEFTTSKKAFFKPTDFWLLVAMMFVLVYLLSPSSLNAAGSVSVRIAILMLYFVVLWLAIQPYPKAVVWLAVAAVLFFGIKQKITHTDQLKQFHAYIDEIKSVEHLLPANTMILTANYSPNWMRYHFRNYIGSSNTLVDVYSPACSPLFTINWKEQGRPFMFVGARSAHHFLGPVSAPQSQTTIVADYVVVTGHDVFLKKPDDDKVKAIVMRDYEPVHTSYNGHVGLYRFRGLTLVEDIRQSLHNDEARADGIREKAARYNIPYEEALIRDALWIYDNKKQ
jgi:hypothetical protein